MRAIALVPSVSLVAGSVAALLVPDGGRSVPLVNGLLIVGLVLALACWWLERPTPLVCAVGIAFAAGGFALGRDAWHTAWRSPLRLAWEAQRAAPEGSGLTSPEREDALFGVVTGVLRSDATPRDGSVSLSIAVSDVAFERGGHTGVASNGVGAPVEAAGGVLLTVGGAVSADSIDRWRAGRTLRMPVRLRRPSRHLDPGVPDEERQLARRGTTLVGSVKSSLLVEVVSRGGWWSEATARVRAHTRRAIARHVGRVSTVAAGLVTAILIGDRAGLSDEVERTLQDAGTYHVVAISGGNIAVLAVVTLTMFRWAGVLGRTAMLVSVCGFLAFGSVVEGGASVDRAVTMAVLSFLARAADHRVSAQHGLAVAAAFIIVTSPLSVADAGFLLSFAAAGGIVAASALVTRRHRRAVVAFFVTMFTASLGAELATLPIVAHLFGRATVAGLVLNVAAVPLMGVTQILGMAVLLGAAVAAPVADLVGWLTALCAHALVWSASFVELVPAAAWRVAPPPVWVVTAYYLGLMGVGWAWHVRATGMPPTEVWFRTVERGAVAVAATALGFMLTTPWGWLAARGDGGLRVTFIDVGQGDAALVQFPSGRAIVVDAGGSSSRSYDVGERVIGPVLRAAGVRALDAVVLTHADIDHGGGVAALIRDFRPFEVWEGIPVPPLPLLQALRHQAAQSGIRWTHVRQGHRVLVDGVQMTVHHPPEPDWERQQTRNDDSIVLELRWHDVSFVLAGDIGRDVEASIAARFEKAPIRVLKVPHHGSPSSSTSSFLASLEPDVAVFSAGRGNPFGHPAAHVLRRYEEFGSAIVRTDVDGAITITTDGHRLDVRTFTGRRLSVER